MPDFVDVTKQGKKMNIAKISISVLLLLSFFFVSGQVSLGIRTIAIYSWSPFTKTSNTGFNNPVWGYGAGLDMEVKLLGTSSLVLGSSYSEKLEYKGVGSHIPETNPAEVLIQFHRLEFPILLRENIVIKNSPFSLFGELGLSPGWIARAKNHYFYEKSFPYNTFFQNYSYKADRFTLGVVTGIGIKYHIKTGNFYLNFRFQDEFKNELTNLTSVEGNIGYIWQFSRNN